ncbi:MAG: hypothetical protein F6J87_16490 [Spirulina sp. SIO3F2]|nr:hypothetical protein [Spirulina sp. SIO3F2]
MPPLPGAVAEILESAYQIGSLTLNDRYVLMAAVLDESLNCSDRSAMDQLLNAIRLGYIRLTPA